jgi:uncharacterized protein
VPSGAPVPTVVLRTPYGRRAMRERAIEIDPIRWVRAGFAVVIQDVRGRGDSEGRFSLLDPLDVTDAEDTAIWVRAQAWSDGRIVTVGNSYSGCLQLQAVDHGLPGLVAAAPTVSGGLRSIWYRGGALRLSGLGSWFSLLLRDALSALPMPDAQQVERLLAESQLERFSHLLEPGSLASRIGGPLRNAIAAPTGDGYWRSTQPDVIAPVPAIHASGWYDSCLSATVEAYRAWYEADIATAPQALLLGPWDHVFNSAAQPEWDLTAELAPSPVMLFERQLEFHEAALRGAGRAELSRAWTFVLGANRWAEGDTWPPPGARLVDLQLGVSEDGTGELTQRAEVSRRLRYTYDPRDPVPTIAGNHGGGRPVRLDHTPAEARADVLVFTSPPLLRDLEIAGMPRAILSLASSVPATDFVVRLMMVRPDGASVLFSDGVWSGLLADLTLDADRSLRRCAIDLSPIHALLRAGSRIRLHVTSSDYPAIYPNPNTGHDLASGPPTRTQIAEQVVATGAFSRVTLPVVHPGVASMF